MKRLLALTGADIRFQFRYGFYTLYLFISFFYVVVLRLLPQSWRESGRYLIVYSDPAALGLFFMGALLLYEKSGRVHPALAVSPCTPFEYLGAKILSLALVSLASAIGIQLFSGGGLSVFFCIGVVLASALLTLTGICLGSAITTLNSFLIITIPAELVLMVPPAIWLFSGRPPALLFHPGVLVFALMSGSLRFPALGAAGVLVALVPLALFAARRLQAMFRDGYSAEVSL